MVLLVISETGLGERWDQLWLPRRPLATDDFFGGVYRMSRPAALGKRYVESNPKLISNLLIVDIDHDDALSRALWERPEWLPNLVVENPLNGRAHAIWALLEAITRTEYARRKVVAFASVVIEGLRRSVDGDLGYSGLLTKNPIHPSWNAHWIHQTPHSLTGLAGHLDTAGHLPGPAWRNSKARRADPTGLGRNDVLFTTARHWAYREIRHHFGDPHGLTDAIMHKATLLNTDFSIPLLQPEVNGIANSISRWIITKSRMWADGPIVYDATFNTIQAARRDKSTQVRK
ncbi:replication initiation protein, partial [Pseudonocardia sp. ICBG1142]